MHQTISLLLYILLSCSGFAQSSAISFQRGMTWEMILQKAREENKYIFVDCYTTWCKPCREMDEKIFTLTDIGKFHNEKFVNVKVQMDSTPSGQAYVKEWAAISKEIRKQYHVKVFPTYLFFN